MSTPRVSFVGRERESARLAGLVRAVPVVTLSGPGGVGKTTLAARVSERLAGEFAGGVCWCDLARVDAGESVAVVIAAALGGRNVALEAAEAELPALAAGRELLVVLDNCEHVRAGAAAAAAQLAGAPGARVLATSRESLALDVEHVVALEPLALPQADDLDAVREAPATRLFAERAAAVRTGFALDERNAADVARLCRRLDGLPLAVELAAARARALSPGEIADRLDERFQLLARRKSRGPDRHRSLRAAIDWSYELLSEPEQVLLARLAVFSAPVTLADVEAVCGGDPIAPGAVLDTLDALVDRSLVGVDDAGGPTRYGMLESLREYARERLADRGETRAVHERRADHYAALADGVRLEDLGGWDATGAVRLSGLDDPLAALRWCVADDRAPSRSFRLLRPLWVVTHSRSAAEITDIAERALSRWGRDHPLADGALVVAAVGHFVLGQPREARALASEAIALGGEDHAGLIARRTLAITVYHFERDLEEADRLLADVHAVAERRGAGWIAVEMSALRGLVLAALGDPDAGMALAERARAQAEAAGAQHLEAWATYVLGMIGLGWASTERARRDLETSLRLARAIDYPLVLGGSLRHLGVIAALDGDRRRAAELMSGSIEHFRGTADRVQRWEALRSAAIALAAGGRRELALRVLDGTKAAAVARPLAPLESTLLARVLPDRPGAGAAREDLETLTRVVSAALAEWRDGAVPEPEPDPSSGVFRRQGDLWTLGFAGDVVSMRHRKGLADLATLLANPGREIHCLELAGNGSATALPGDLGEVIDSRARDAYRARAEELGADVEDARRANDPVREERARDELAALAEQLEAAYGLGGRARRAGDPAERARTAVAWRIRSTLGKLDAEHARLARHLRNAVKTGTWCVYEPEAPVRWEL